VEVLVTVFVAVGKGNLQGPVAHSPRDAARAFFQRYPTKRICHVGEYDQVGAALRFDFEHHRAWSTITPSQIDELLPEEVMAA
jgi:hypothetical protein